MLGIRVIPGSGLGFVLARVRLSVDGYVRVMVRLRYV